MLEVALTHHVALSPLFAFYILFGFGVFLFHFPFPLLSNFSSHSRWNETPIPFLSASLHQVPPSAHVVVLPKAESGPLRHHIRPMRDGAQHGSLAPPKLLMYVCMCVNHRLTCQVVTCNFIGCCFWVYFSQRLAIVLVVITAWKQSENDRLKIKHVPKILGCAAHVTQEALDAFQSISSQPFLSSAPPWPCQMNSGTSSSTPPIVFQIYSSELILNWMLFYTIQMDIVTIIFSYNWTVNVVLQSYYYHLEWLKPFLHYFQLTFLTIYPRL